LTAQLVLRRDPRVSASDGDLIAQMRLAQRIALVRDDVRASLAEAEQLRRADPSAASRIDAVAGAPQPDFPGSARFSASPDITSLRYDAHLLEELEDSVESADQRPTNNERSAWAALERRVTKMLAAWKGLRRSLPAPPVTNHS
jgi:hypothetical protein